MSWQHLWNPRFPCHETDSFAGFIGGPAAWLARLMKMIRVGTVRVVLLWLAGSAALFSQQAAVEEISLRLLPLGNRAPFTQVVRDGVRHEVDPPEGSLPPREIAVGIAAPEGAETGPEEKLMRLRLGEPSGAIRMPRPEPAVVVLRDRESGQPWLKQGLAAGGSTLLVVWRTGKTWEEPRSLALDDSPGALPAGTARIVNVAPVEMKLIWGKQRLRLLPGKHVVLRYPGGSTGVPLEILYTDRNGALKSCLSTTAEADPGKVRQWFIHRADRADARNPFQVVSLAEAR